MTDPISTAPPLDDDALRRALRALLTSKKGIDESKAKRLRKQWDARAGEDARPADLEELFTQLRERIHEQVARREEQFAEVTANLEKLQACMDGGDVAQSKTLEKTIINALGAIRRLSNQRREKIINRLEELRPELRELTAWRKWGTRKARETLIKEIRGLHKSESNLTKIAQRIQRAREQWQQWDADGEGVDAKLYANFDRECAKAYRPCKAHFEKQKKSRKKNAQRREKICEQLEDTFAKTDWRDPDWKSLRALLHARRNEWRKTGSADPKSRKSLQLRFDAVMEKLDAPLEREQLRNFRMREKLSESAKTLLAREDAGAAYREYMQLKKQWIVTAASANKKERALWRNFSATGTQLYDKRKLSEKDQRKTLRENIQARENLCAEIEASCGGDAHDDMRAQLKIWKSQWEQLLAAGDTHKPDKRAADAAKKNRARYHAAIKRAQKILTQSEKAAAQSVHALLRKKSDVCAQLEAFALAEKGDDAQCEKLIATWDSMPALPPQLEEMIGARYARAAECLHDAKALQNLRAAINQNRECLHGLLLQLEIFCEHESPPEFSKQRMALQIARLSAAMGKADDAGAKNADELMREILLTGAVDVPTHAAAMMRLDACTPAKKITATGGNTDDTDTAVTGGNTDTADDTTTGTGTGNNTAAGETTTGDNTGDDGGNITDTGDTNTSGETADNTDNTDTGGDTDNTDTAADNTTVTGNNTAAGETTTGDNTGDDGGNITAAGDTNTSGETADNTDNTDTVTATGETTGTGDDDTATTGETTDTSQTKKLPSSPNKKSRRKTRAVKTKTPSSA